MWWNRKRCVLEFFLFLITLTSQLWCRVPNFRHKWKRGLQALLNHSTLLWEGSVSARRHVVLVCPHLTMETLRPYPCRVKASVKGLCGFRDLPQTVNTFAGLSLLLTLSTRWWPGQVQAWGCHALVHLNRNTLMRAESCQQQHWLMLIQWERIVTNSNLFVAYL